MEKQTSNGLDFEPISGILQAMTKEVEIETRYYAFGGEDLYKEDVEKMKRLGFKAGEQVPIKDIPIRSNNPNNTCEGGVQYKPGFRVDFKNIS